MREARKNTITAGQLFLTLFVARIVILLSTNTVLTGGESLQEFLPSCLGAYLINFILVLPLWFLHRVRPEQNLLEAARSLLGKAGLILVPVYAVYFICFGGFCLSLLQLFMANVMEPHASLPLLAIVTALAASYAAWKGIETIGRTAALVSGFAAGGLILILLFLSVKFDPLHFTPFFEDGGKQAVSGTLLLLARSDGITALGFLSARMRGNLGRGFVIWNTAVYALTAGLLAVMTGAMGSYLGRQLFPVYAASSFAEAGVIQGMDAVLIGIWLFSLLVKLSVDLFQLRLCVECAVPRAGKWAAPVGALLIAGLSVSICSLRGLQQLFYSAWFFFPFTLICVFVVPSLLLLFHAVRSRTKNGGKGKRGKRAAALLLVCGVLFTLTGCQQQIRLNRRLLIEGIGIDRDGEEYVLTVQSTKITEGETREVSVYTAQGPSILEALGSLTQQTGQDPLYSHALVVVFGRSSAEYGIAESLDFFIRNAETRPNAQIMMAEGDAAEILTAKREEKTLSSKVLGEILETENMNGRIARISMTDFVNLASEEGSCPYLPVVRAVESGVEAAGTAVLDRDGKLLGILDGEATRGALYLLDRFERGLETVRLYDGALLTVDLHDLTADIVPSVDQGQPRFSVSISCSADIGSLDTSLTAQYGEEAYASFEKALADQIKKEAQTALDLCLVEYRADIFRFCRRLHQAEPAFWAEHAEEWQELAAASSFAIQVSVDVARVGQEDTPPLE